MKENEKEIERECERDWEGERERERTNERNSCPLFVYKRQSALLIGLILAFDINGCLLPSFHYTI